MCGRFSQTKKKQDIKKGLKVENKIIKAFAETLEENKEEGWAIKKDKPWTWFLIKVLKKVGKEADYYVRARDPLDKHNSGEYLNIDVLFFRNSDYKENRKSNDYDEPVMPIVAVELENNPNENKIVYCLWKLLCLRVSTRLLVCYQTNSYKQELLKKHLEEKILKYDLMKQDNGSLFVIIGDERAIKRQKWCDYYRAFKWKNNRLSELKIFQD